MDKFTELGQFIQDAMARFHVPGVAVGVIHDGQEYTAGFGVTNVNHPLPVDGGTLFQIGSTTKTFTATAIMRLVEQGKLNLQSPISHLLPDFKMQDAEVTRHVTAQHLLTHTGGWLGDYFDDTGNGDDALAIYVRRMADLPQLTPLGTVWSYNNAGFSLAGRVIEAVTGQTYEAALTDLVLKPLGLAMSFIMPTDVMTHRFVAGHIVMDDTPVVAGPWPLARSAHAAGAIASTAQDQLRYARFHMGVADGANVLTPDSIALMQTPIRDAALDDKMALSWFVHDYPSTRALHPAGQAGSGQATRIVRHGGATKGQLSAFLFAPEHGFALTVLTNADRGAELQREVTKWALEHFLGVEQPEPQHLTMSDAQLAEYTGRYIAALADVELKLENGALVMRTTPKGGFPTKDSPPPPTPPPARLAFVGADRVVALDPPSKDLQGEFLRAPDGRIAWFRFGSRIRARVTE